MCAAKCWLRTARNPLYLQKFCLIRRITSISSAVPSVSKNPTLADEVFELQISGLKPHQKITLHSSLRLPSSAIFESLAHYFADEQGCVSLDRQESHGGSFTGVEPMGPLSFMKPSPLNKRKHERFIVKDPTKPFTIDFRVLDGFIPSLDDNLAKNRFETPPKVTITRLYMLPGVQEIPIWHGNVRATLYVPEGKGPFPGVVSMSGGYPGAMKYKASLLASHGFAALALKYFGEDDLADDYLNISLDYIEEAVTFMANHKLVNKGGVGIVANCYGGTIGLAAASVFPEGLIRCVASTNGWSFPMGNFTYKGESLKIEKITTFYPTTDDSGITTLHFDFPIYDASLDRIQQSSAPFYDRHKTSYLFICAENDGYLPCPDLVLVTRALLESAHHPDYEILYYKGAGHLIEHSFIPLADVAWTLNELHFCGGKQPGHSIAQNNSWPKVLAFIRSRLSATDS